MKHSITKPGYYLLTMKLKDFSCILLLLFTINSFSQYKISGIITSENGIKLALVEVYDKTSGTKYLSNTKGEFSIELEKPGNYDLVFYKENYAVLEKTVSTSDESVVIVLDKVTNLSEVVINTQKDKIFALNKLKDIDETAIYAGKKTEVISLN